MAATSPSSAVTARSVAAASPFSAATARSVAAASASPDTTRAASASPDTARAAASRACTTSASAVAILVTALVRSATALRARSSAPVNFASASTARAVIAVRLASTPCNCLRAMTSLSSLQRRLVAEVLHSAASESARAVAAARLFSVVASFEDAFASLSSSTNFSAKICLRAAMAVSALVAAASFFENSRLNLPSLTTSAALASSTCVRSAAFSFFTSSSSDCGVLAWSCVMSEATTAMSSPSAAVVGHNSRRVRAPLLSSIIARSACVAWPMPFRWPTRHLQWPHNTCACPVAPSAAPMHAPTFHRLSPAHTSTSTPSRCTSPPSCTSPSQARQHQTCAIGGRSGRGGNEPSENRNTI